MSHVIAPKSLVSQVEHFGKETQAAIFLCVLFKALGGELQRLLQECVTE